MVAEIKAFESIREAFTESAYRFMIARIAIYHLKHKARSKADLYRQVNKVLKEYNVAPVSYGFIKINL